MLSVSLVRFCYRHSLESMRKAFYSEKQESLMQIEYQRHALSTQTLRLETERESLQEERSKLWESRIVTQQEKDLVEPYIRAARIQRDEAVEIKREAKRVMDAAEERLSRIVEKERELLTLEQHYVNEKQRYCYVYFWCTRSISRLSSSKEI